MAAWLGFGAYAAVLFGRSIFRRRHAHNIEFNASAKTNGLSEKPTLTEVSSKEIDFTKLLKFVAADTCGAVSSFVGVTRNHHDCKKVTRLEYEAHPQMAVEHINKICTRIRQKWDVHGIAVVHRTGLVPVGEASIAIAISSVHRVDSLEATRFCIDEVKKNVPVWKKEFYAEQQDSAAQWKSNAESSTPKLGENVAHI